MSWQEKVVGLYKRFGAPVKFAAKLVLGSVVPGGSAVVDLVGLALDCVDETARDQIELDEEKMSEVTAADLQRLEDMLAVLGGADLSGLMAKVAALESRPDLAAQTLALAQKNDGSCQAALYQLEQLARGIEGPHGKADQMNAKLPEPQRAGKAAGRLRSRLWVGGVAALLFLALGGGYMVLDHWGYTPGSVSPAPRPRDKDFTNSIGMKLALIPAGKFQMGSPGGGKEAVEYEKPRHEVKITQPFFIGVYPVTKKQFAAFVEGDDYMTEAEQAGEKDTWRTPNFLNGYGQTDDDPVVEVTWKDARTFCEWLSKKEKKTYRLPTEAQWEYACRAGTETAYSFGDNPAALGDYAWFDGNALFHTHPVGGKKPNPWDLYDMHGNVWEWCADYWYDPLPFSPRAKRDQEGELKDPQGFIGGEARVLRGGAWDGGPGRCRSAYFNGGAPGGRLNIIGCRVVLCLD